MKQLLAVLLTISLVFTYTFVYGATLPNETTFYKTNFEDTKTGSFPSDWELPWSSYDFSVVDDGTGNKALFSNDKDMGNAKAVVSSKTYEDVKVEASVRTDGLSGPSRVGIMARYKDINNQYVFMFTGNGTIAIMSFVGGTPNTLAQRNMQPMPAGQYVKMSFQIVGEQLTGYIDDIALITTKDSAISKGGCGVYTHLQKAFFGDYKIEKPSLEPVKIAGISNIDTAIYYVDLTEEDSDKLPSTIIPPVFEPVCDEYRLDVPTVLGNQELARLGYVDVTSAPFNADNTGRRDATKALQNAINFSRDKQMVCYLPGGTYTISDTLLMVQGLMVRSNWNLILATGSTPCIITGPDQGERAKIVLAPGSKGFSSKMVPKYMLEYQVPTVTRDADNSKLFKIDTTINQYNILFSGMIKNLDFEIGENNPGASAIYMNSAEFSGVQNVNIYANDGYCGIKGGSGNGASWYNVKVVGGDVGIDMANLTVPTPVMEAITLIDQKTMAMVYSPRGSLAAIGLHIESKVNGPIIVGKSMAAAKDNSINLIDSTIVFKGEKEEEKNRIVFNKPVKNIYMNNVFVENADEIVENNLEGNPNGWIQVKEAGYGVTVTFNNVDFHSSVYIDGVQNGSAYADVRDGVIPPDDLQTRHLAGVIPDFQTPGIINVKEAPYFAVGDGITDDTEALQRAIDENEYVFLPKGFYRVTKTIQLKPYTKLFGTAAYMSTIYVREYEDFFGDPNNPQPVVATANDKDAETVLANLNIMIPWQTNSSYKHDYKGTTHLKWQCGRNSVFFCVNISARRIHGFAPNSDLDETLPFKPPFIEISGNGGGKWYNAVAGISWVTVYDDMYIVTIDNTSEPLVFYNTEFQGDVKKLLINNSKNITIYGSKTEGDTLYFDLNNSDNIRVFGHGGNGTGEKGGALFEIKNSDNFIFTNIADQINTNESTKTMGTSMLLNYKEFYPLTEKFGSSKITVAVDDRPVIYKRGNPRGNNDISVLLDNKYMSFDIKPIKIADRVMVPMRVIFEALGAHVQWNEDTSTVTGLKDGKEISIKIGDDNAKINGVSKPLDVPAVVINGRTLVPVRFVSESFDANVLWDEAELTVVIKQQEDIK